MGKAQERLQIAQEELDHYLVKLRDLEELGESLQDKLSRIPQAITAENPRAAERTQEKRQLFLKELLTC